jgi:hypothetical protein
MNREEVEIRTIEKLIIQFDFYSSMSIDFGNETKNMKPKPKTKKSILFNI